MEGEVVCIEGEGDDRKRDERGDGKVMEGI